MQRTLLALALLFVLPVAAAHAQAAILPGGAAPAQPTKPAATTTTPSEASPAAIAPAPMTPAADPTALKVKAEINPATGKLTVRTDNPGPTRIEVNDVSGRPLLTYTMMVGTTPAALDIKQLSPGSYVVRCTAGDRIGMRRVTVE